MSASTTSGSTGNWVLYDLPSREPCSTWSLNPWKIRLLLNYKGLNYTTKWYPDLKPMFEPHVPANETGALYTSPTVQLPDGSFLMESRNIANAIETMHPEPSIHLDSPYTNKVVSIVSKIMGSARPIYFGKIPRRLLNDASLDHWYTTRTKLVGMPLDQYEKENPDQTSFKRIGPALKEVTELLKQNSEGPFFMGNTPSWADFVWIGFLVFFQRIGEDVFQAMLEETGDRELHLSLLHAASPWLKRNDH